MVGGRVWASVDTNGDGNSNFTSETLTDGSGHFVLEDLAAGETQIRAEKGSFYTDFTVDIPMGEIHEMPSPECIAQGDVDIAVVEGSFDDIGGLLNSVGLE